MGWYTEIHIGIHIYNRNQHCHSNEPNRQNKSIERHLLVMKNVGVAESKSVFVLFLFLEPLAEIVVNNAQKHRLCKVIVPNNEVLTLKL